MKGVCSLLGGVDILEGMVLAVMEADFDDNGGTRIIIMVGEPQIACLGNEFFDTTTPQPKRLRPDIRWGNIWVWTKPFYTGTSTGLCILAQGWVVLKSLAVDYD